MEHQDGVLDILKNHQKKMLFSLTYVDLYVIWSCAMIKAALSGSDFGDIFKKIDLIFIFAGRRDPL